MGGWVEGREGGRKRAGKVGERGRERDLLARITPTPTPRSSRLPSSLISCPLIGSGSTPRICAGGSVPAPRQSPVQSPGPAASSGDRPARGAGECRGSGGGGGNLGSGGGVSEYPAGGGDVEYPAGGGGE